MKYMLEYTVRSSGSTYDQNISNGEALLNAFAKWKPEEGLNVQAFVAKLSNGGYVLVEAADPTAVASFITKFLHWNDVNVVPVIDIAESVPVFQSSLSWARSASKG